MNARRAELLERETCTPVEIAELFAVTQEIAQRWLTGGLPCGAVASVFGVDPKTPVRWAKAGRLGSFRTPGGHHRFPIDEVRAALRGERAPR